MDSNIAYLGQVPDWDDNDEQLLIGSLDFKRFITLSGIVTNLLAGDDATVDLEVTSIIILLLPSFSTSRDFFSILHDRFDIKRISNSTNSCREQKQLKILAILLYWLRSDTATMDITGSLVDSIIEFLEETISTGSESVIAAATKVMVRVKLLQENLAFVDEALIMYQSKTASLAKSSLSKGRSSIFESNHAAVDEDDDCYSRGSSHSGHRCARRGSESSLVNVSLGGDTTEDLLRSNMLIAELECSQSLKRPSVDEEDIEQRAVASPPKQATISAALTPISVTKIFSHESLAENLTILDFEGHLKNIRARELVNLNWTNASLRYIHPELGGASHLCRFLHSSNQRIAWIAREVIDYARYEGPANECIEFFVRVARNVLKKNNFNAFFNIVAALGLPAVLQLKGAWTNVAHAKQALFKSYLEICNCDDDYANYRKHLQLILGQPFIPCLQVWLRDIAAIENSGPWIIAGRIDMLKAKKVFYAIYSCLPDGPLHRSQNSFEITIDGALLSSTPDSGCKVKDCASKPSDTVCAYATHTGLISASELNFFISTPGLFGIQCLAMKSSLFYYRKKFARSGGSSAVATEEANRERGTPQSASRQRKLTNASEGESVVISGEGSAAKKPGVFRRLLRSVKSLSFSTSQSGKFLLTGDDLTLFILQAVLDRTSIDIEMLSQDSKLADDAESKRLISKLTKAGLF